MIQSVSIISGEAPYEESIDTRYTNAVKEPSRDFINTLYVCDRDIVYNNSSVDITEAWLINNNAYIYKIEDEDIVKFTLNEESCESNVASVGAVVSQQFTARLINSEAFKANCTIPDVGYDTYFENKCLIAFNRLALEYSTNEEYESEPTVWGSVPLGVFYVKTMSQSGELFIDITCYDKMLELDRKMTFVGLNYLQVMNKMRLLFKVVITDTCMESISEVSLDLVSVRIPTDSTYRSLLKYAAVSTVAGFIRFNRYGKLEKTHYTGSVKNFYGEDILSNKLGAARSYKVASANNGGTTINNGYAVQFPELGLLSTEQTLRLLEGFSEVESWEYSACKLNFKGFPHLEAGDIVHIRLQKAEFNENTCEYEYIDQEPFFAKIHKQQFTFSGGVAQSTECYDIDTQSLLIASTPTTVDIPTQDGFFNMVFDKGNLNFTGAPQTIVSTPVKYDYKPHSGQMTSIIPRQYNIFATPKTKFPSKVYPLTIDLGDFQQNMVIKVAGYSSISANIPFSYLGIKGFNSSTASEQINANAYVTQDYVLTDEYEEYHTANSGYILLDNFIIEWGIVNCESVSVSADNEYYGNVTFVKEFAEEPTIILTPLTSGAYEVTGCSYENITTTGMRVYNCNTVFSQGGGKAVQWLAIGRSKNE